MAKLRAADDPQLLLEMEAMDRTTEGHYSQWNRRYQQLLDNDKYNHELCPKDGGDWSGDTSYRPMTIVRHNGASYYSIQPSTGQEPGKTTEYWRLIARDGNEVTVDPALSSTSTNPVQNKAVTAAIAAKGAPVLIQETAPSDTSALWVW